MDLFNLLKGRCREKPSVLQETQILIVPYRLQKESRLAEKVDYPAFKGASVPPVTANGASVSLRLIPISDGCY